jgi:hypothetical protein
MKAVIAGTSLALVSWSLVLIAPSPIQAAAPRPANNKLLAVAPEECLLFIHNFGFTASNSNAINSTERLFAEPSVQQFVAEVRKLADQGLAKMKESSDDTKVQLMQDLMGLVKLLVDRPSSLYVTNVQLNATGEPQSMEVGFVVDAGEKITHLRQQLDKLKSQVPASAITTETIAGVPCLRIDTGDGMPLYWGTKGESLIASIGDGSFENLINNVQDPAPAWLGPAVQRLPVPRPWLLAYVNGQQVSRLANRGDEQLQKVWSALGMNETKSITWVFGLDDEGILTRSLLSTTAKEGVVKFFSDQGLTADDLTRIPQDVVNCGVMRLDPSVVFDNALEIVGNIDPQAAAALQQSLTQVSRMIQADIRKQILAGFGDRWVAYTTGQQVSMLAPDMLVAVDVRDASAVQRVLNILEQAVNGQNQPFNVGKTKIGDRAAYYLSGFPIAPAWCLTKDRLVVGMQKQTIAAYLDGQPDKSASIAAHPRVAELFQDFKKPFALTLGNSRASMQASYSGAQLLLNMGAGQLRQQGIEFDPTTLPPLDDILKHLEPSICAMRRTDDGLELVSRQTIPSFGVSGASTPILVALLLPAVNAARAAARRNQSMNNLKMLALANANYESATGHFPAARFGKGENRGLSWRVAILPYLEGGGELYDRFHHDEPWDSEHNRTLIGEMPAVYRSPASSAEPSKTNYLAIRGEDSIIADIEKGNPIRSIRDGTSKTALIIEVDDERAVTWTKPDDYEWAAGDPTAGLGNLHPGNIFLAAFADGHVTAISREVDKNLLQAIFTKSGGERADLP